MTNGDFEATVIHGKGAERHYYKGMLSFVDITRRIHILWTTELIIGREDICDIYIPDNRVSRKHAHVSIAYDGVRFSDLASSNGSTRNGEKVDGTIILNDGDEIGIAGAFRIPIKIREEDDMALSVLIKCGVDEYLLTQSEVLLGKKPSLVDVVIDDPTVADMHAQVEFIYDTPIITASADDSPIMVNEEITKSTMLKEYAQVRIGNTFLTWK